MSATREVDAARDVDHLERITEVLVSIASGDFSARAPRDFGGGPWDVLAFLVNSTAEEVAHLVAQLEGERRALADVRDQLVQAEKLASLGELAGGVAHELNQPLTAIRTMTDLLFERPDATIEESRSDLALIHAAAKRMGRIVSAVRAFGRQIPLQLCETDVREPIDAALALLSDLLTSSRVRVEIVSDGEALPVRTDADALQQVFINLLSNACDALVALPEGSEREIEIELKGLPDVVRVSVSDSGDGIEEEAVGRIFDPFFSTKAVGQGAGLGLSISHGIVTKHGGTLRYAPTSAGGACFIIELPHAAGEGPRETPGGKGHAR